MPYTPEEARSYRHAHRATLQAAKLRTNRLPLNVIKRAYSNIIRRTSGKDPHTPLSIGLPVGFTRDEFITWTLTQTPFMRLHEQWRQHYYVRRWAPSIDRLDDFSGYVPGNVQWIVWQNNQAKTQARALVYLTWKGRTQTKRQWSKETGIHVRTIESRRGQGWTDEQILTTPVGVANRWSSRRPAHRCPT